jgi:hypothetical protein
MDAVMYGMMPRAQVAAAEQVEDSEERTGTLLEDGFQDAPVDARRRNVRTDAIHRQKGEREQNAVPQIRDAEHVSERFEEFVHVLLCSLTSNCFRSC